MRILIFVLITFVIKCYSKDLCVSHPKDMDGNNVDVSVYCSDKLCLTKCCDGEKMLYYNRSVSITHCANYKEISKELNATINFDYSDLVIYQNHANSTEMINSTMKVNDFKLISNNLLLNDTCGLKINHISPYILDDGNIVYKMQNILNPLKYKSSPNYCFEKYWSRTKAGELRSKYKYYLKLVLNDDEETKNISRYNWHMFAGIGMVISVIFLLVTFIVYCLLKELRDHQGIITMAYVGTLTIAYIIRAVIFLDFDQNITLGNSCFGISVLNYLFTLSTFFWVNIMSFEIWWTSRGLKMFSRIERRIKFMWYGAYAWGIPLLMTLITVIIEATEHEILKPHFRNCLSDYHGTLFYLHLPIAIITIVNTTLFAITMVNIWLIKRSARAESHSAQGTANKQNQQRFWFYIKIAVLMGVNWLLELMGVLLDYIRDEKVPTWLEYVINVTTILLGVILFVILICKKSVFYLLCKRLNIKKDFVEKYKETYTRTVDQMEELQALN